MSVHGTIIQEGCLPLPPPRSCPGHGCCELCAEPPRAPACAELALTQKQTWVEVGSVPLAQRLKPTLEMEGARVPLPSTRAHTSSGPEMVDDWLPRLTARTADTEAAVEFLLLTATRTGGWIVSPQIPVLEA